jgi:hypothetical protein
MHPPEFLAELKRVAKGTLVGEKLFRTNSDTGTAQISRFTQVGAEAILRLTRRDMKSCAKIGHCQAESETVPGSRGDASDI